MAFERLEGAPVKSRIVAGLALALVAILMWVAWSDGFGARESGTFAVAAASTNSNSAERVKASDLASPESARSDAVNRALADAASAGSRTSREPVVLAKNEAAATAPGHLIVEAVDAETNVQLPAIEVRLASETRFAREASKIAGEVSVELTPDTYAIVVGAPGYEPVELPRAVVTSFETERLPPAKLRAGNGSITAILEGTFPESHQLDLQLIGAGRHPCSRCGDVLDPDAPNDPQTISGRAALRKFACPVCGYARERSSARVASPSRFEFTNLASGCYALRLIDERGLVVAGPYELTLRAGDTARARFEASSMRYVSIEWLDVDGRSLSEIWRDRVKANVERMKAMHDEDDPSSFDETIYRLDPFQLILTGDAGEPIATASFAPPPPNISLMAFSDGSGSFIGHRDGGSSRVDRERRPEDSLRPEPEPVHFGATVVTCDLQANGTARIGPLPNRRLVLRAATRQFAAEALVLDSADDTRVVLRLYSAHAEGDSRPPPSTYCEYEIEGSK